MSKRRNQDAAFKARVASEERKGERTVSELATAYRVHPTMIHQWSEPFCAIGPRTMASAQLEGAASTVERGCPAAATAEIAEDIHSLHLPLDPPPKKRMVHQNLWGVKIDGRLPRQWSEPRGLDHGGHRT